MHGNVLRNIGSLFSSTDKCGHDSDINLKSLANNCNAIFSGKLHSDIGLMFSSCGYLTDNVTTDNASGVWTFLSPNFNKQLYLSSYNSTSAPAVETSCNKLSSRTKHWNSQILNLLRNIYFYNISPKDEHFIKEVLLKSTPRDDNKRNVTQCSNKNGKYLHTFSELIVMNKMLGCKIIENNINILI